VEATFDNQRSRLARLYYTTVRDCEEKEPSGSRSVLLLIEKYAIPVAAASDGVVYLVVNQVPANNAAAAIAAAAAATAATAAVIVDDGTTR